MSPTADLLARLRRHYIKPNQPFAGGVFVPEVGMNGRPEGSAQVRRCDAVYVGFTSTSGRLMIGHELKVSRADWLHELDVRGKADAWHDACHEWWVVAPSTDVVEPATLPAGWGLMIPSLRARTRMQVVVPAARDSDVVPPWWAVRSVFARLDTLHMQDIADGERQHREQIRAEVDRQVAEEMARLAPSTRTGVEVQAVEIVKAFRDAGVELTRYRTGRDHSIGPGDVAPLRDLIHADRAVARVHKRLTARWGGVEDVLNLSKELVAAATKLGQVPDSAGENGPGDTPGACSDTDGV